MKHIERLSEQSRSSHKERRQYLPARMQWRKLGTSLTLAVVITMYLAANKANAQRKVLVEVFSSSTCPHCATMNAWLNPLLASNADKVAVISYQMSWPGKGDAYYTAEGGTRRTFYGVSGVPASYVNGVLKNNQTNIQDAINTGYAQPAEATINGSFTVKGNTIVIEGSVTPLISGSGYTIYVAVNEKTTYKNASTNGETEFRHIMMKMFPNGNGVNATLTSGVAIPFSYTYNMSTTFVEEMNDLEVVVFVQNASTKAVLNADYLKPSESSGTFIPVICNGELKVYPNPTNGELRIDNGELTNGNVEIYDVYGKKMVNGKWSMDHSMDVSHLPGGMYFLKIGNRVAKFIKI